jgi:hypothetical protein
MHVAAPDHDELNATAMAFATEQNRAHSDAEWKSIARTTLACLGRMMFPFKPDRDGKDPLVDRMQCWFHVHGPQGSGKSVLTEMLPPIIFGHKNVFVYQDAGKTDSANILANVFIPGSTEPAVLGVVVSDWRAGSTFTDGQLIAISQFGDLNVKNLYKDVRTGTQWPFKILLSSNHPNLFPGQKMAGIDRRTISVHFPATAVETRDLTALMRQQLPGIILRAALAYHVMQRTSHVLGREGVQADTKRQYAEMLAQFRSHAHLGMQGTGGPIDIYYLRAKLRARRERVIEQLLQADDQRFYPRYIGTEDNQSSHRLYHRDTFSLATATAVFQCPIFQDVIMGDETASSLTAAQVANRDANPVTQFINATFDILPAADFRYKKSRVTLRDLYLQFRTWQSSSSSTGAGGADGNARFRGAAMSETDFLAALNSTGVDSSVKCQTLRVMNPQSGKRESTKMIDGLLPKTVAVAPMITPAAAPVASSSFAAAPMVVSINRG